MDDATKKIIEEQFKQLPPQVQKAMTSTAIDQQFQALAKKYGLHYDQWDKLENEIMLTVLGLADQDEMVENITSNVGIAKDLAINIVNDIANNIFKPIREELERELEHPEARAEKISDTEAARKEILSSAGESTPILPATPIPASTPAPTIPVAPATPPPPPLEKKVVHAALPTDSYKPGEPSINRKNVHDDPYRESPA